MLLPIHTIDVLYYKRMFWFYNEKANKKKPEEERLSKIYIEQLTFRLFAHLEEVYNSDYPGIIYEFDDLVTEYNVASNPVHYFEEELKKLKEDIRKAGWDNRIKIKVKEQTIGNQVQLLHFYMDLDETLKMISRESEEVYRSEVVGSDIIENPTPEQLVSYDKQIPTSKIN